MNIMGFFNFRSKNLDSKEFLQLKQESGVREIQIQQLERQIDFLKLQFKDLKTLISRRLKLELDENTEKEKNKKTNPLLTPDGNPLQD